MNYPFLKPLIYFDVFDHPLKRSEIEQLCPNSLDFDNNLNKAIKASLCYKYDAYYGISPQIKKQVEIRLEKEQRAKKYLDNLRRYAKLISKFPFVKGIAISGSLSKNVMHDDGDIDYFIVTKKNRLWLCRTLLILFKKVFLLNSRKYFCVNYFVDEDNLEIRDKNIFTAIELTYLLPVYNTATFNQLREQNNWVLNHFQPINHPIQFKPIEPKGKLHKNWVEKLLDSNLGERIDLFFMGITIKRWKKKFSHFDAKKMELTMRSNRGISKHHPSDFQNKVLQEYEARLNKLTKKDESIIYT